MYQRVIYCFSSTSLSKPLAWILLWILETVYRLAFKTLRAVDISFRTVYFKVLKYIYWLLENCICSYTWNKVTWVNSWLETSGFILKSWYTFLKLKKNKSKTRAFTVDNRVKDVTKNYLKISIFNNHAKHLIRDGDTCTCIYSVIQKKTKLSFFILFACPLILESYKQN